MRINRGWRVIQINAKRWVAVLEPLFGRLCLDLSGERGWEGVGLSEEFVFDLHEGLDQDCMPMEDGLTGDELRRIPQSFTGRYPGQINGNGCANFSEDRVVDDVVGRDYLRVRLVKDASECGECLVEVGVIEFEAWEGGVQTGETECRFDEEVEFEVGGGGGGG